MKTLALFLLFCAGCHGVRSTMVYGPDGKPSYRIRCNADIAECYEEAGAMCQGNGYTVVNQSWHYNGPGDSIPRYNLIVTCKAKE